MFLISYKNVTLYFNLNVQGAHKLLSQCLYLVTFDLGTSRKIELHIRIVHLKCFLTEFFVKSCK